MLGCSQRTVARMCVRGVFPGAFRVGDAPNSPYLILLAEVQSYLKQRAQSSGEDDRAR